MALLTVPYQHPASAQGVQGDVGSSRVGGCRQSVVPVPRPCPAAPSYAAPATSLSHTQAHSPGTCWPPSCPTLPLIQGWPSTLVLAPGCPSLHGPDQQLQPQGRDSLLRSLDAHWLGAWGTGRRCQSAAAHPAVQLLTALGRAVSGMRFADYFLDLSGLQRLGCSERANYSNKLLV